MKKALTAIAILGAFSSLAQAQSSVAVYGIVDAGIVREQGGVNGSATNISSGIGSASRLGFRGTEDLGNGVSALFLLEAGYRLDTGASDVAGAIFNRQAYVGLKSAAGTLTIGRQYTPYYNAVSQVADPFGAGFAGSAKNLMPTAGVNTRTSNSIVYVSPVVSGFSGELSYSLAEQGSNSIAGRQLGAALSYGAGKLNARLAHNHRNNDIAALDRPIGRNTLLAANYNFGPARAFAAWGINQGLNSAPLANNSNPFGAPAAPAASLDSRDMLIGVQVPFGANALMASFIRKDDKSAFNQDADQWALGLTHSLSKRTSLYTSFGKSRNRNGAGYTVGNNSDVGSGDTAYNAGVRHSF
jgi:predicted porin